MVQFNPLQGLGVASQLQQMDEMRLRQQEAKAQRDAQSQQQARLQELIPMVQQGDYNASIELATINPQMATAIEQAKSRMSEGQDKATADWIIGYHTAPDKEAYLSQDNPSIDIDDQFRTMPPEQREVLTKIVGAQVMPQQTFEAAFSSAKGPDFQYKDGLVFNPATGDVERTEYYQDPSVTGSSTTTETSTANSKDWATYQELKKTDPEGAKQFGRKVGFVSADGTQLSSHLQKRLSAATDNAIEAENAAASLSGLAKEFEQANVGGGLFQGKWSEAIKDATGSQDAVTELRRRYTAIRGSQVVNNLPPGAASDKDIDMALAGFPSDNATGEQISSFLTGLAKLERERAKFENFKANYISENSSEKGMLKAWKESQAKPAPAEMSDDDLRKELGL